MTEELVRGLARDGTVNHVVAFRNNNNSNVEILRTTAAYVEKSDIIACHGRLDLRALRALRRYLATHRIDIVHSHKYKTNLYALLARNNGCGLVATCHNWRMSNAALRLYAAIDKRVLRGFDAVVAVSREIETELRRHLRQDRTHRIENGIDVLRFSRIANAKQTLALSSSKVVGFVGRLSEEKAVDNLLSAAPALIAKHPDILILIVGDGILEAPLRDQALRLKLGEHVRFLGRRDDLPELYSAFDVLVLPSHYEAFPMTIIEAMACGTAVVATRVGDVPDIIEDGVSGRLVEPADVNALSAAIDDVLANDDRRSAMGAAGARKARACFSAEIMARRYGAVYESVLGVRD